MVEETCVKRFSDSVKERCSESSFLCPSSVDSMITAMKATLQTLCSFLPSLQMNRIVPVRTTSDGQMSSCRKACDLTQYYVEKMQTMVKDLSKEDDCAFSVQTRCFSSDHPSLSLLLPKEIASFLLVSGMEGLHILCSSLCKDLVSCMCSFRNEEMLDVDPSWGRLLEMGITDYVLTCLELRGRQESLHLFWQSNPLAQELYSELTTKSARNPLQEQWIQQFRFMRPSTDPLSIPCCLESRSVYLREALKDTPVVVDTSEMTDLIANLFQVSQLRSSPQLLLVLHGASLILQDPSAICEIIDNAIRLTLQNPENALDLSLSLTQLCCPHLAQYSEQYRFICCLVYVNVVRFISSDMGTDQTIVEDEESDSE